MTAQSPRPVRVALVSARFVPMLGGTELHVAELAPRLAALGYEVEVLTTDPSGSLPRVTDFNGARVRRWRAWPRGGDLYFAPGLLRRVLTSPYDIVHVQGVHTLVAPMSMAAAVMRRTPFLVTFHTGGHPSRIRNRLRSVQWLMLSPLLRRASALIAVSRFEQELFARAVGVPQDAIHVVPNGVSDTSEPLGVAEDPGLIISVGRLERYKGHQRVIAALPHVMAVRPDARVLILGTGPQRSRLLAMADALGVADRVSIRYVPPGERATMRALLGSAALVALLSAYEAHPLAVTEALSLGRRVIVADTSGLSEIAETGLARAIPLSASPQETAAAIVTSLEASPPGQIRGLPSWDDAAVAVHQLYATLAGR